jgi:hypothetical protein
MQANCRTLDGRYQRSSLDLNSIIGNIDGQFQWGSQAFSRSATGASIQGAVLTANLRKKNGTYVRASINLDARITNNNGNLQYR